MLMRLVTQARLDCRKVPWQEAALEDEAARQALRVPRQKEACPQALEEAEEEELPMVAPQHY